MCSCPDDCVVHIQPGAVKLVLWRHWMQVRQNVRRMHSTLCGQIDAKTCWPPSDTTERGESCLETAPPSLGVWAVCFCDQAQANLHPVASENHVQCTRLFYLSVFNSPLNHCINHFTSLLKIHVPYRPHTQTVLLHNSDNREVSLYMFRPWTTYVVQAMLFVGLQGLAVRCSFTKNGLATGRQNQLTFSAFSVQFRGISMVS